MMILMSVSMGILFCEDSIYDFAKDCLGEVGLMEWGGVGLGWVGWGGDG